MTSMPEFNQPITIPHLCRESAKIAESKGWGGTNATVEEQCVLIMSEWYEAFEEWRAGVVFGFKGDKPIGMAYELADVVIRVGHIAHMWRLPSMCMEGGGAGLLRDEVIDPRAGDDLCLPRTFGSYIRLAEKQLRRVPLDYARNRPSRVTNALLNVLDLAAVAYGEFCPGVGTLSDAVHRKWEYNRTRQHLHGGKRI